MLWPSPPKPRPPPSCSFLIRQQHKGRSQRNKSACLAFKIKADRYEGVKEKHVHTDVATDWGAVYSIIYAAKNRYMYLSMCVCVFFLSFVCLFLPLDKDGIFKRFIFYWNGPLSCPIPCQSHLLRFKALSVWFRLYQLWPEYKML